MKHRFLKQLTRAPKDKNALCFECLCWILVEGKKWWPLDHQKKLMCVSLTLCRLLPLDESHLNGMREEAPSNHVCFSPVAPVAEAPIHLPRVGEECS